MKFNHKLFREKIYKSFQFIKKKIFGCSNFLNIFINTSFCFFLGYFFSNLINIDFFISFVLNQLFFTKSIIFLFIFIILFMLSTTSFLKKWKKFILFFLMILSFINGFNFFLKCKHTEIKKAELFQNTFDNTKNLFLLGFIENNPIYINNKIIFEFSPYFITTSGEEVDRIKKFFLKPKKTYPKFIVISDIVNFRNIPKYKDSYILNGNIRMIEKEEINFLYKIGIKNNLYFSLENIKFYEKTQTYISFFDCYIKNLLKKYNNFFNKAFKNNFKMNYSLIDWIIFGEKHYIPNILKTKRIIFNPLFLIIESKFFIWFILLFPILLLQKKRMIYKIKVFFTCLCLMLMFNFFQKFNTMTNNVVLFSTLYYFFYSILNFKKEKSIKFSFIILNYLNIFLMNNYFLYSERFFMYFCLMSAGCIYFFEIIDDIAKKFLNNWKLLGYTFFIMFSPLIFLINWKTLFFLFHIRYAKIFFSSFLLLIVIISHILSYYYPIINMHFKKIPIYFRVFLIIWFINNFFIFLPMSIFYGENFSLSLVILLFPLFCFLIFIFLFYFFVYIISFLSNFVNFNFIKIFILILARIFYKYLTSIAYRLTESDIPKDINIFLFFSLFFSFIIIFYFYNKITKEKYKNFLENVKHLFYKFQSMLYLGNIKAFTFCAIIFLLSMFFLALYIKNRDALNCYIFKNNYASFCYLKTYDNQKILYCNIKNINNIPINLMFEYFYSDFYFLKYLNINKIDTLIINNFTGNYYIFPFLKDLYENKFIKNNHSKLYVNTSKDEISKIKNLDIDDIFLDKMKISKFLKLNSFFDDLKKLNIKIHSICDEDSFDTLEENFEKHFLLIKLSYKENDIVLNIKNEIDTISISHNKNFSLPKKNNTFQDKILLDDNNKIIMQSVRGPKEIENTMYIDWQYINIVSFGNKIQIKYLERKNV